MRDDRRYLDYLDNQDGEKRGQKTVRDEERRTVTFGPGLTVRFTVHFAIRPHGWNGFARLYGLAAKSAKSLQDS